MLEGISAKIEQLYANKYEYDVKEIFRASAIRQLGQIYFEMGFPDKALEKFLQSETIAKRLVQRDELPRPHMNLSNLDLAIGDAQRALGNLEQARDRYISMIEHRKIYLAGNETLMAEQSLAHATGRLGDVYRRLGQYDLAREHLAPSLAARRKWHQLAPQSREPMEELAGALGDWSSLHEALGEFDEMNKATKEALALLTRVAMNKSDVATMYSLAIRQKALARQSLMSGADDAGEYLVQAVEAFEKLLSSDPNNRGYQTQTAEAHYWLGVDLANQNQPAEKSFDRSIALERQALAASPANVMVQGRVLKCLARAGHHEEALKLADEFALRQESGNHCAFSALAYGFLWQHADKSSEEGKRLAAQAVAQTRRFIQLGCHKFKL